jgi:hypothetical protein
VLLLVNLFVTAIIVLYPAWRMFGRAGFPPGVSLVVLVPGVGFLVALGILAFAEWPAHTRNYDQRQGGVEK